MTAEIAIINRRAVVLAADSAVSIRSSNGDVKVFNSAEKVFELCSHLPIGLMVYNGVNFLEAPLDVLARDFRQNCKARFNSLRDCAEEFLVFLKESGAATSEKIRDEYIEDAVADHADAVNEAAYQAFRNQKAPNQKTPQTLVREVLERAVEKYRNGKQIESHKDLSWQDVYAFHKKAIDGALENAKARMPLDDADMSLAQEWAARALLSDELGDNLTGLVVAGYGATGSYPALVSFEIDGFVYGRLRCEERHNVETRPGGDAVDIITFAQEDISRRLLDGIDPAIVDGLLRQLFGHLGAMRQAVLANVPPQALQMVETDWNNAAGRFVTGINQALAKFMSKCNSEFYSTVAGMPKQEMAFFAESLVNTTAMKRKVSSDQEDVGGPVDVAVISRHDGFVWAKRKHYFEREFNPRYFARIAARGD